MNPIPVSEDPIQIYKLQALNDIQQRVASLGATLEAMQRQLLGNGQPGFIQTIESRVDDIDKTLATTRTRIAYFSGMAIGASTALSYIISLFKK